MHAAKTVAATAPEDDPAWLLQHRRDVHSQSGEDGVIEKALELLPERDRWCVEFGAWDGIHLSNTRNLIVNHGYSAAMIEGSASKVVELRRNYASNGNVHPIHAFVGFDAATGLDRILESTPVPADFDFLSIDIDGNDYHVWKAMKRLRPKLIAIEYNPTIHTDIDFVQPPDPDVNQGASLAALVRLGREKGYELVCALPWNGIFVRDDLFDRFRIRDNSPYLLRRDTALVTYVFSGFDGHVFLRGGQEMPWHRMRLEESRVQHLPGFMRKYPGRYGYLRRMFLRFFRAGFRTSI